jgi:tetratricopeptide (TPR) repeat protein
MKKILIASSCAIMLCFTSCATKQAPETDSQIEVAETEASAEDSSAEAPAEENTENNTDEVVTEEESEDETSGEDTLLTSEDFPEPEEIDEPEIITLEPVEEEASENQTVSEEVEKEEPPEITIVNSNEENQNEQPSSENENLSPEENNSDDLDVSDVIIVSNPDSDDISGGIDITDDDSASDVKLSDLEKDITPSRTVTLKKFEYLDVTYPGTGWIYMGLTDNSKDLAYFGRKLGTKDTKFSLQARAAGTKIIHFYRNDPLTGQYLDDYIEVIITAENGSNKTHIEAPEYKLPVQKKEKTATKVEESESLEEVAESTVEKTEANEKSTSAANSTNSTSSATTTSTDSSTSTASSTKVSAKTSAASSTEEIVKETTAETTAETSKETSTVTTIPSTDSLLKEAQVLYNEKEYASALKKINQFFEYSTDNRDEALYLKGQILEAKSDVRDIKGALDAYTTLTKNYPASKYWDDANKRIIYLKRFYLEVR